MAFEAAQRAPTSLQKLHAGKVAESWSWTFVAAIHHSWTRVVHGQSRYLEGPGAESTVAAARTEAVAILGTSAGHTGPV